MTEQPTAVPTRPELLATTLRIDLSDSYYATLANLAERLAILLADSAIQTDANAVSSLDDLLGAIYSLILARHHHFDDRPDGPIELNAVSSRAQQLQRGDVRLDGKWIAGWHFNSALFRVAAVYHRLLKLVSEAPETKEHVPALLPKVQERYNRWSKTSWTHANADTIHSEVNTLKHASHGVHHGRAASFRQGVGAVEELLVLLEAWRVRT